jgi:hypothetical protein
MNLITVAVGPGINSLSPRPLRPLCALSAVKNLYSDPSIVIHPGTGEVHKELAEESLLFLPGRQHDVRAELDGAAVFILANGGVDFSIDLRPFLGWHSL